MASVRVRTLVMEPYWRRRRSPLQSAVKSGSGSVWQENRSGLSEDAEKVPCEIKSVPQRLKPRCEQSTCGTAEAVPLSKTGFFSSFFSPWSLTPRFPGAFHPSGQRTPAGDPICPRLIWVASSALYREPILCFDRTIRETNHYLKSATLEDGFEAGFGAEDVPFGVHGEEDEVDAVSFGGTLEPV